MTRLRWNYHRAPVQDCPQAELAWRLVQLPASAPGAMAAPGSDATRRRCADLCAQIVNEARALEACLSLRAEVSAQPPADPSLLVCLDVYARAHSRRAFAGARQLHAVRAIASNTGD